VTQGVVMQFAKQNYVGVGGLLGQFIIRRCFQIGRVKLVGWFVGLKRKTDKTEEKKDRAHGMGDGWL
jgi:hypothetical protein